MGAERASNGLILHEMDVRLFSYDVFLSRLVVFHFGTLSVKKCSLTSVICFAVHKRVTPSQKKHDELCAGLRGNRYDMKIRHATIRRTNARRPADLEIGQSQMQNSGQIRVICSTRAVGAPSAPVIQVLVRYSLPQQARCLKAQEW